MIGFHVVHYLLHLIKAPVKFRLRLLGRKTILLSSRTLFAGPQHPQHNYKRRIKSCRQIVKVSTAQPHNKRIIKVYSGRFATFFLIPRYECAFNNAFH